MLRKTACREKKRLTPSPSCYINIGSYFYQSFAPLTSQNSSQVKQQQKAIVSGNICALSAISGLLHSCKKFLTSTKLSLCTPKNKKLCLHLIIFIHQPSQNKLLLFTRINVRYDFFLPFPS